MISNSKNLAKELEIEHKELMKFYWKLEDTLMAKRNLIKCTLNITPKSEENYLSDMSESLQLAIAVKFEKTEKFEQSFRLSNEFQTT